MKLAIYAARMQITKVIIVFPSSMPEGESVAKTPNGNGCQRNADCASDVCLEGYCALKEDSASTRKGNVPNGTRCSDNSECQSGYCINSVCQADDTPDNTQKANGGGCIWNDA